MNNFLSGTNEWSVKNANFITGCKNNCTYCFSKAIMIHYNKKTQETWKEETVRQKDINRKWKLYGNGRVMFPSSHDITPQHLDESIKFLQNILLPGNEVLIVSKPHLECIKKICDSFTDYKDNILFRFTIGSTNNDTLKFWEPGAPSFEERLASLKYAFDMGYQTSISAEPMLDNKIDEVIDAVRLYVTHSIWLGKMNEMKPRLELNTEITKELKEKANQLYAWQSDDNVKELYEIYKNDPLIRWKSEIKKVTGIPIGEIGSDE